MEDLQPGAQVAQTDTALGRRFAVRRQARAVIVDAEAEMTALPRPENPYGSGGDPLRDPVLDRVLHERLQQQVGNQCAQQLRGNVHVHPQPFSKADLLDVEIALQILDLLLQGDLRPMGVRRGTAEKLAQTDDHAHRGVVQPVAHQACYRIERVVHEVRLYLPAQRGQLRVGELLIEPCCLGRLARDALPCVDQKSYGDYLCVYDHEGEDVVDQGDGPRLEEGGPVPIAPRVEGHLQHGGPTFVDHADGGEGRKVHARRVQADAANDRIAPRQVNHQWSRQRPRQPGDELGPEERRPRMMSAFRMHDEDGLTGFEQGTGRPDRGDPAPTDRAHITLSCGHSDYSTPMHQRCELTDAMNGQRGAADGLRRLGQ